MNFRTAPVRTSPRRGRAWPAYVVALGGIALVVAFVMPVWQGRIAGPAAETRNSLKQIGLARHNFEARHGAFPPWAAAADGGDLEPLAGPGDPPLAWQTALLPYVDAREPWRIYETARPYDAPANAAAVRTEIKTYLDRRADGPAVRGGFAVTHYAGNARLFGPDGARRLAAIADGTTTTLMAGQAAGFPRPWADPDNLRDTAAGFGAGPRQFGEPPREVAAGRVVGGAYMMRCDGSVGYYSADMDPAAFAALGTPDGGEALHEWDEVGESRADYRRRMKQVEAGSALLGDG